MLRFWAGVSGFWQQRAQGSDTFPTEVISVNLGWLRA